MYLCHDCEYANPMKLWKCPNCWAFGTFIKDPTKQSKKSSKSVRSWSQAGQSLTPAASSWARSKRYDVKHKELERILSKWVKAWGLYLLWGEPGIGKSTIMLQIIEQLISNNKISIGYFSWEEDISQITERKVRLEDKTNKDKTNIAISWFDIFHTTHLEDILSTAQAQSYDMIIIDSIQTVYTPNHESVSGSIAQIKRCSEKISERCKNNGVTCFLIWHVTKGGEIAWPKYLEHIVDVVMYLEGDRYGELRFLRTKKNRFGSSDEVGIFEMTLFWLQPVYDLKDRIISQASVSVPWSVLTSGIDNGRPVLVHLEVLLNKSNGKFPQRVSQWIETKRLYIIIAVLERYLKLNLDVFDIYVNIPGEFTFRDTGLDVALAAAIRSQTKNKVIDKQLIFIWEIWLGGQILPSKLHKKRTKELTEFDMIDYERIKHISELPHVL